MENHLSQKYSVTSHYVLRKIADECILVPVSPDLKVKDCLFLLNETGIEIYTGVKSGLAPAEIVESILKSFSETGRDEVKADVELVLGQMLEIEAIHAC